MLLGMPTPTTGMPTLLPVAHADGHADGHADVAHADDGHAPGEDSGHPPGN